MNHSAGGHTKALSFEAEIHNLAILSQDKEIANTLIQAGALSSILKFLQDEGPTVRTSTMIMHGAASFIANVASHLLVERSPIFFSQRKSDFAVCRVSASFSDSASPSIDAYAVRSTILQLLPQLLFILIGMLELNDNPLARKEAIRALAELSCHDEIVRFMAREEGCIAGLARILSRIDNNDLAYQDGIAALSNISLFQSIPTF